MKEILREGMAVLQDEVTYHYQEDPFPGGIRLTVHLSGDHYAEFLKQFAKNENVLSDNFLLDCYRQQCILEWLSKREEGGCRSLYVLNRISSLGVEEDELWLVITASPLVDHNPVI